MPGFLGLGLGNRVTVVGQPRELILLKHSRRIGCERGPSGKHAGPLTVASATSKASFRPGSQWTPA